MGAKRMFFKCGCTNSRHKTHNGWFFHGGLLRAFTNFRVVLPVNNSLVRFFLASQLTIVSLDFKEVNRDS